MRILIALALGLCLVPALASAISFQATSSAAGTGDARYVNVVGETNIFELDTDGNLRPTVSGVTDPFFEISAAGNITPKDLGFMQNSNGDLQPLN